MSEPVAKATPETEDVAPAEPFPADETTSAADNEPVESSAETDSIETSGDPQPHATEAAGEEEAPEEEFDHAEPAKPAADPT